MARGSALSARAGRAAKSGRATRRSRIDFSDIPKVSPAQLRAMRRVGRPPLGEAARRLIAIRIDPQVLDAVRREAKRRGLGYQSLINDLLAEHVRGARSA
jgi:uncharacterized protein (DUF4415 family)